jgi:hypothetical protein
MWGHAFGLAAGQKAGGKPEGMTPQSARSRSNQFFGPATGYPCHKYSRASGRVCCFTAPGVARKYKLIVIALGGQRFGHVLVGDHPVVQVVAHGIRVEKVPVADFHPDAQRLGRRVGDEVFMELRPLGPAH